MYVGKVHHHYETMMRVGLTATDYYTHIQILMSRVDAVFNHRKRAANTVH